MSKQLFRSRTNRMIGGVCAGLADYFNLDPTLVRLAFVFGGLFLGIPGSLVAVYIILMLVIPEEPAGVFPPPSTDTDNE
jgi:phage shock protein PspC (stress-responsive transcriptional regulator)